MNHSYDSAIRYAKEEIKKIKESYARNCETNAPRPKETFIKIKKPI
jgi:hypothetical protein